VITPLRIEFSFESAIVESPYPIHFDDLLAFAYVQKTNKDFSDITLPLDENDGAYKASALIFSNNKGPEIFNRIRRFDDEIYIDRKADLINDRKRGLVTTTGWTKTCVINTVVNHFSKATAWCVGNKHEIENLLSLLTNIGPLSRLDYGRVRSINVTEDSDALTKWKQRNMPNCPDESNYYPVIAATQPPYWKKSNQKQCWVHKNII
jgi:CRISPR type IV-associated protein Csf3